MKNNFLLLTLTLLLTNLTQAQFMIGPTVGLNISNIKLNDLEEGQSLNPISGISFGAVANIDLAKNLYLQPELRYSQQGAINEFADSTGIYESKAQINYIAIPILLKYSFKINEDINLFLLGGPRFSYGIGKVSITEDGDSYKETFEEVGFKKSDLGLDFGLGLQFGNFTLDGRYTLGLSNLNDEEDEDFKASHRIIGINLGYFFSL